MPEHLIVIFDRSSSMNDPFQASTGAARSTDFVGQHPIKIQEAQEQLIARLKKSQFEIITIIPFHSMVEPMRWAPFLGQVRG